MQFFVRRRLCNNRVHKSKKVFTALGLGHLGGDVTGRDLQSRKQVERTMTFVCAFEAARNLAAAGLNVTGRSLQRLDAGFLIDADNQGILGRTQIQADNIRRLYRKFFVCTDAPGSLSLQTNGARAKRRKPNYPGP